MKILIVSQYFWPENFCINELATALVARGHAVEVLTGIPNYPSGKFFDGYGTCKKRNEEHIGVAIRRVPILPRRKAGKLRLILNYLSFVLSSCLLGPFLCRNRYDVIFVYGLSPVTVCLPALLLRWMRRIPIIFWVQDLWPESLSATGAIRSSSALRLVGRLVSFIYRGCDRILVQSEGFRRSVELMGGEPGRIEYYPNAADPFYIPLSLEDGAPERAELPKGFCVMFAGNIGAAQDFGTILCAAEKLKERSDIHWVIIGDGRQRQWVEAEVARRNLQNTVHLLGRKPAESMPRYFSLADVMLLTLKKDPIFALTIPTKLQAYLACGKPIVAAIDGEGARIIEDAGAGMACPAEDASQLADMVLRMRDFGGEERRCLGLKARAYSEKHFEKEMLLDRLEEIFGNVVCKKQRIGSEICDSGC